MYENIFRQIEEKLSMTLKFGNQVKISLYFKNLFCVCVDVSKHILPECDEKNSVTQDFANWILKI